MLPELVAHRLELATNGRQGCSLRRRPSDTLARGVGDPLERRHLRLELPLPQGQVLGGLGHGGDVRGRFRSPPVPPSGLRFDPYHRLGVDRREHSGDIGERRDALRLGVSQGLDP